MRDPRMIIGYTLLIMLFILAIVLALGTVRQETSFGLQETIECLRTLAAGFVIWAFTKPKEP